MSRSLRRSRRAPKSKSDFNVGDVVELQRNGTTTKATLAQLLTDVSSPNPRWLVNLNVPPYKEEVYEHIFNASFAEDGAAEEAESANSLPPVAAVSAKKEPPGGTDIVKQEKKVTNDPVISVADKKKGSTSSSTGVADASSDGGKSSSNSKKKAVSFSDASSSSNGKIPGSKRSKVSAREARSRRRQALMDEPGSETLPATLPVVTTTGKRKVSGAAAIAAQNKRLRLAAAAAKSPAEEAVTKVKFLTGTLYIHRGKHRRVEFVRRV